YLKRKPLQVFRLGNHGNNWMVRRLSVGGDAAEDFVRVEGGREDGVLEQPGVHVMGAAKGRERAAGAEQFERAQMNLLIAAQCVRHRSAIAREGRRIEDDEVEFR